MSVDNENVLQRLESYFNDKSDETKKEFHLIENVLNSPNFSNSQVTVDQLIEIIHADPNIRFSVRGFKIRPKPPELNSDRTVILSKKMAAILRHGLHKCGLEVLRGSFVRVKDILGLECFEGFTRQELLNVVNDNDKKRYELLIDESNGDELIRAVQGHSVVVENVELNLITDVSQLKHVYHATFYSNWESIIKTGLSKMGRNHIHFYTSNFKEVIRDSAEIIIEINTEQAIKDGIKFYIAKNHVVLSEGVNGILDKKYFLKAWDRKTKSVLYHKCKP